jgi:hypothetical protein
LWGRGQEEESRFRDGKAGEMGSDSLRFSFQAIRNTFPVFRKTR